MSSAGAAITGRLEETSLFDLCHLLLPRKGCLQLERPESQRAKVWLSTGVVLDAQVRSLVGYDAFMEIARWHVGNFKFLTGVELPEPAIEQPYNKLALDAALYVDLWNNLSVWNVNEQTVISRYGYRASKEHEVFVTQEVVLAWNSLHGPLPVEAVMEAICEQEFTRLDALNAVHHLLALGVVRPEAAQHKPQPRVVAAPGTPTPAPVPIPTPRPVVAPQATPAVPVPRAVPASPNAPGTPTPRPVPAVPKVAVARPAVPPPAAPGTSA